MDRKQREVLVIALHEKGKTYREITKELRLSPNTIKAILNRVGLDQTNLATVLFTSLRAASTNILPKPPPSAVGKILSRHSPRCCVHSSRQSVLVLHFDASVLHSSMHLRRSEENPVGKSVTRSSYKPVRATKLSLTKFSELSIGQKIDRFKILIGII